jgi:CheY-like chemotaxis protein
MPTLTLDGYRFLEKRMPHQNRRVLVVEDEEESQVLIKKALGEINGRVEVNWVKSAEEAEDILNRDPKYDLIIADHLLVGHETGLELWETCQKKYTDVPFILMSAINASVFQTMTDNKIRKPLFLPKPFVSSECRHLIGWYWEEARHFARSSEAVTERGHPVIETALAVLSVLLLFALPDISEIFKSHRETGPVKFEFENIVVEEPLIIQDPQPLPQVKKERGDLINEILSRDLRARIMQIQLRADEILESFESGTDTDRTESLPRYRRVFPLRGVRDFDEFDWKFESYGRLCRVV